MKRLTLILSVMLALVGLNANAAIYIVGDGPLGGWAYDGGNEMFDTGNGVYQYEFALPEDAENTIVYFVFADGRGTSWDEFNNTMRIGPTSGNVKIEDANWVETQKAGGDNGAYFIMGIKGESYTVTYDLSNNKFKVDGAFEQPPVGGDTYTVAGAPAALFGTEWAPGNTDNDMTLVDGLYTWTKENVALSAGSISFKVVVNHTWAEAYPSQNHVQAVENDGIYNVKITFNPDTKDVNCELTLIQSDIRGDVDGDGEVAIADVTVLIDYLLSGQTAPAVADCDQDGEVSIADVTCLIDFLLSGNWPVPETVYTVAGTPTSLFGSEWDATNESNDMVKGDNGVYIWKYEGYVASGATEVAFKIVQDHNWAHSWPANNFETLIGTEGAPLTVYIVTIVFDPNADDDNKVQFYLQEVQNPE